MKLFAILKSLFGISLLFFLLGNSQAFAVNPPEGDPWGKKVTKAKTGSPDTDSDKILPKEIIVRYNSTDFARTLLQIAEAYKKGERVSLSTGQERQLPNEAGHVVSQKAEIRRAVKETQRSNPQSDKLVEVLDDNLISIFEMWSKLDEELKSTPDEANQKAGRLLDAHIKSTIKRDYGIEATRAPTEREYLSIKRIWEKKGVETNLIHKYSENLEFRDKPKEEKEDKDQENPFK